MPILLKKSHNHIRNFDTCKVFNVGFIRRLSIYSFCNDKGMIDNIVKISVFSIKISSKYWLSIGPKTILLTIVD